MQNTKISNTRNPWSFKETNNSATTLQMFPKYKFNLPFLPSTFGDQTNTPPDSVRLGFVEPLGIITYLNLHSFLTLNFPLRGNYHLNSPDLHS